MTFLHHMFTFFPDFQTIFFSISLTFPEKEIKLPFSLTGKGLVKFPGFPEPVGTLVSEREMISMRTKSCSVLQGMESNLSVQKTRDTQKGHWVLF